MAVRFVTQITTLSAVRSAAVSLGVILIAWACNDRPPEVLSRIENNRFVITVEKVCGPTAMGHCYTAIYLQTHSAGWLGKTNRLLASSRDVSGFAVRFLDSSLLLAEGTRAGTTATGPVLVMPLGLSDNADLYVTDGIYPEELNRTGVDSTPAFWVETFAVTKLPQQHLIHLIYRRLTSVTRNIYITCAETVEARPRTGDLVEIDVRWIDKRPPSKLMALMPGDGRQNIEIYVADSNTAP